MWWDSMSVLQQVMFIIACVLTAILIIQIILMFVGGSSDADASGGLSDVGDVGGVDIDVDVDVDIDIDTDVGIGADVDASAADTTSGGGATAPFGLKLLSLRSILAFAVVGAWLCYTLCYFLDWYWAVIIAACGGAVAACGMAAALVGMDKLQDNGNINPDNTVGKIGTVYLTVPPNRSGKGKVNILVQERYAEYEAITDSDSPLATSSEIQVVGHAGANVLIVKEYKKPSIIIENE